MSNEEIQAHLEAQDEYLQRIWQSVEKTRKYLLVILWGTVLMFVVPLIGLALVIPIFVNTYLGSFEGLIQ